MLFAGIKDGGIYISKDSGGSWQSSASGMEPNETVFNIVIDPSRPNVIYAGGRKSGVYLSENYGETWRLINKGLSSRSIGTLEISSDGLVLYAGTFGGGVFRLSTHEQAYFDSLAPTPTAITPTSLAAETPAPTSTPVLSTTAPATREKISINPIYIGGTIILLITIVAFSLWRRKSRSE